MFKKKIVIAMMLLCAVVVYGQDAVETSAGIEPIDTLDVGVETSADTKYIDTSDGVVEAAADPESIDTSDEVVEASIDTLVDTFVDTAVVEQPAVVESPIVVEQPPVIVPPPVVDVAAEPPVAGSGKPRVAVYVTGADDPVVSRALGTYILDALVKSGRYVAIERTEAFLAEIDNEHVKQRSGAIDDAQISELGKQSGVSFVCIADVAKALRGNQVSVRMLNVETAEVAAVGVSEGSLSDMKALRRISESVVNAMLGLGEAAPKRLTFGVRAAYLNSFVNGYHVMVEGYDDESQLKDTSKVGNETGVGHGFEFALMMNVRLTKKLSVETGANFIMRAPITIADIADVNEFALSVPLLLRVKAAGPLFFIVGGQFEVPFGSKMTSGDEMLVKDFEDTRKSFDAGAVLGLGVNITKGLSIDIRGVVGAMPFDDKKENRMIQASAGVGYMF